MAKRLKQKHGGTLQFWEKGESGNLNGRPRKVLSLLAEKVGVDFSVSLSKEDKYSILESMLEMSIAELKAIATDNQAPAFIVIVAGAIRKDISSGKMATINDLFDRFFGRPKQVNELTGKEGQPLFVNRPEWMDER